MPRRRRAPRPGALVDAAPLRILVQIILLQVIFYVSAACMVLFTALVAGKEVELDLLLSWRTLRGDITVGWMLGLIWMLNSLICVIFLLILVARSKLIPDFALTIHLLHLVITSIYSRSIPTYWFWWALQTASASLMTSVGVWSCRYRELQPMSFGGTGTSARAAQQSVSAAAMLLGEMGRGRDRGREEERAEAYELVDHV